jgi:uncharacterized protein YciW
MSDQMEHSRLKAARHRQRSKHVEQTMHAQQVDPNQPNNFIHYEGPYGIRIRRN